MSRFQEEYVRGGKSTASTDIPHSVESSADSPKSEFSEGQGAEDLREVDMKRDQFRKYWESAAKEFGISNEGMMLKKTASKDGFVEADRREIATWLTRHIADLPVDKLIEIGAGIGRLTPLLQEMCHQITAIDFMEDYIIKNRELHYDGAKRPNDEFLFRDATKLTYEEGTFDVVLWNWLLMYLTDQEVKKFVRNAFRWVKIGGYLFCRESCGEPSNKNNNRPWAPEGNPTEYRPWSFYSWLLCDFVAQSGVKVEVIFKETPVSVYQREIGTDGQRCWLIRRVG